jgi:hypothetical protein
MNCINIEAPTGAWRRDQLRLYIPQPIRIFFSVGFPEGGEGGFSLPAHGLFFRQQRAEKFRIPLSGEGLEGREDRRCEITTEPAQRTVFTALHDGLRRARTRSGDPFGDLFEGVSHSRILHGRKDL